MKLKIAKVQNIVNYNLSDLTKMRAKNKKNVEKMAQRSKTTKKSRINFLTEVGNTKA